ncbi:MAG: prenyltransferase/squalene oxidase repeat-containing protein [Solirubrobacterales bacterium]
MSWQLAAAALLAVTILGGALWYERSRPPSQVVALIAALAALSIAGRVAFSPIPNVVPTTDITLIAGFTLGGPAGFAVGALSALVSNFWLGQGPWTPWQMAGWGMVGLLGAMLAAATGRRLGRVPLALACAFAGLAYGALLDLSLMVTYGGEQSLDRFLALSARGIPFNVAHAAGNFALALAAGPALIRMLDRYRGRFEVAWGERGRRGRSRVAIGAAGLIAATALAAAGPGAAAGAGGGPAAAWLLGAQNADGGFGAAPGEESSPGMTGWAVLGLAAAGQDPLAMRGGGRTPIAYLRETVSEITTTGDIERTIMVLCAAGLDPRDFQGRDLVVRLLARRGRDGSWGRQVNPTAFGVLALVAAGHAPGTARTAAWLRGARNGDGGWGFIPGSASDADSTGAALQALAAAGGSGRAIRDGVAYLRSAQAPGGGFTLQGGPANAQSTAWAVQGLIAAGVSPRSVRRGGRSPLDYLASVRAGDGHYRYSRASDQTPVWVTGQALQAVSGRAFPLPRVASAAPAAAGGEGPSAPPIAAAAAESGDAGTPAWKAKLAPESAEGARAAAPKPGAGKAAQPGLRALEELEPLSGEPGGQDDGTGPPWLALALLALAAAAGGAWALRRRGRPG